MTSLASVPASRNDRPRPASNASPEEGAASSSGHSADRSTIIRQVQMDISTDDAERSAGKETSGGSASSSDQNTPLPNDAELTSGTHIEASTHKTGHSAEQTAVASRADVLSPPLPTVGQAADGGNVNEATDTERMESESLAAAPTAATGEVADLNTQQQQSPSQSLERPALEEDAEMSSLPENASSDLEGNFLLPLPVLDPKHTRSFSSISGSESDISENVGFTKVEKRRPGRPKKPRNK